MTFQDLFLESVKYPVPLVLVLSQFYSVRTAKSAFLPGAVSDDLQETIVQHQPALLVI
jgi:hypothetical protein